MKAILTVIGKDKVGIIAAISNKLSKLKINILDVNQTISEKKNEFEILYENKSIYTATLSFINIIGSFNLENLRKIKVYNKNSNLKYKTEYNYVDNQLEEFIPFKYLITNFQKFYQLRFINQNNNEDDVSIFLK